MKLKHVNGLCGLVFAILAYINAVGVGNSGIGFAIELVVAIYFTLEAGVLMGKGSPADINDELYKGEYFQLITVIGQASSKQSDLVIVVEYKDASALFNVKLTSDQLKDLKDGKEVFRPTYFYEYLGNGHIKSAPIGQSSKFASVS